MMEEEKWMSQPVITLGVMAKMLNRKSSEIKALIRYGLIAPSKNGRQNLFSINDIKTAREIFDVIGDNKDLQIIRVLMKKGLLLGRILELLREKR